MKRLKIDNKRGRGWPIFYKELPMERHKSSSLQPALTVFVSLLLFY